MDSTQSKQAFWTEHIRAWRRSGLTQAEYCNQHGLKLANLGYRKAEGEKSRLRSHF